MAIGNRREMIRMEHWTPKEIPRIVDGHQTHMPLTCGGAALKKPHKGKDGGGKRMGKRKSWFEDVR